MKQSRRVCLLIDTATSWGVRLIKGIGNYAQEAGNWLIHVEPWGRYERFRIPEGWEGDGLIARVNNEALADEIAARSLPTINVSWYPFSGERIVRCTTDPEATGKMAAEYFLSERATGPGINAGPITAEKGVEHPCRTANIFPPTVVTLTLSEALAKPKFSILRTFVSERLRNATIQGKMGKPPENAKMLASKGCVTSLTAEARSQIQCGASFSYS